MFTNLAAEIKRCGLTQKQFARMVKINEVVFSRKINSEAEFKYSEIKRILEFFKLKLAFDYLFEETDRQFLAGAIEWKIQKSK